MNIKALKIGSQIIIHLIGVTLVALLVAGSILPKSHVQYLSDTFQSNTVLFGKSQIAMVLHIGLSACLWAMGFILYQLGKTHWQSRKTLAVKRAVGSVMTETLVILPLFFLLVFGMAQLAINNVGGILANVAVYEAGRSAWVWQPEEAVGNRRLGVVDDIAQQKAEIAIALVMMPIAPGEFVADQDIGDFAESMRCAAIMSHVPVAAGCGLLGGVVNIQNMLGQLTGSNRAVEGNRTFIRTLGTKTFIERTWTKFTHAVHAANADIAADTTVTMEYNHQIAMPLVGPVFGQMQTVGGRQGYYTTYERTYGFRAQINTPNAFLPNNDIGATAQPPEPQQGDLQGQLE